jgi:hypothetical protein
MLHTDQSHPLHPRAGHGSLVAWLGHGQQRLLPLLEQAGVTCTASPLHFMSHNRELSLFAAPAGRLGLALDPMTPWRQLPKSHRGKAFRAQPFGGDPTFDPCRDRLSTEERVRLAETPLDAQRAHGATLLMTTYHLSGDPDSRGRQLDLELARLGAEHYWAERMDEPPIHAALAIPRQLYAALGVERDVVSAPGSVERLAAAYAELDVDGYWLRIERFDERGPLRQIEGAAALLGALAETGRPVVCCGPGALHLALLVSDISSCVGFGEGERFSMPDTSRPRPEGPRLRTAYHPGMLRSFQPNAAPAQRAFKAAPCRRGSHPKRQPPQAGSVEEHGVLVRAREAREALDGSAEERREWLRATAAMASHLGHDAGVDVVPYSTLAAVLDGVDAGRGDLTQVA